MNFKSNAADNSGEESRGQRSIIENIEEQLYEKWCENLASAINKNLREREERLRMKAAISREQMLCKKEQN